MPNDLVHVQSVMTMLEAHGIKTWLFGGWAEQLHGMIAPRAHRDIDLLYHAEHFTIVDRFLQRQNVGEIVAKRFAHKRAFEIDGIMTELIIVRSDLTTHFWDQQLFRWPPDVFSYRNDSIRLASPDSLIAYRRAHDRLRWTSSVDAREDGLT